MIGIPRRKTSHNRESSDSQQSSGFLHTLQRVACFKSLWSTAGFESGLTPCPLPKSSCYSSVKTGFHRYLHILYSHYIFTLKCFCGFRCITFFFAAEFWFPIPICPPHACRNVTKIVDTHCRCYNLYFQSARAGCLFLC